MKTITFYSYKGGVGRSLVLANLAQRLVEFGKSVCMLDFDLEAPGLPFKFDAKKILAMNKKGVVDFVTEYQNTGRPPQTLDDEYTILLNPDNKNQKPLHLITAGNTDKPEFWKNLAGIDWKEMFYSEQGQGYNLMLHLKALIEKEINPDYLLIDSRTGVTETSGITLSVLPDRVVIVAANNQENIYGSKMIMKGLNNDKNGTQKIPIHFVLSRVPFTKEPNDRLKEKDRIDGLMAEFKEEEINISEPGILLLHSDRELEEKEKLKIGEFKLNESVHIGEDYRTIFKYIIAKDLDALEIEKYERQLKANAFFLEYSKEQNQERRLELITQCIELYPIALYYILRASDYKMIRKKEDTISDYETAISLAPNVTVTYLFFVDYLKDINNNLKALKIINRAIELFPDDAMMYTLKASLLEDNIEKEANLLKAVSLSVDFSPVYQLSMFYFISGRFDLAYQYANKAYEKDNKHPNLLFLIANLQLKRKNIDDFYITLDRALELKDDSENSSLLNTLPVNESFRPLLKEERFQRLLYKYNITMKLPETPPQEGANGK